MIYDSQTVTKWSTSESTPERKTGEKDERNNSDQRTQAGLSLNK